MRCDPVNDALDMTPVARFPRDEYRQPNDSGIGRALKVLIHDLARLPDIASMKEGPSLAELGEIVVIANAAQRHKQLENVTVLSGAGKRSERRSQVLQTARAAGKLGAKPAETAIVVLLCQCC